MEKKAASERMGSFVSRLREYLENGLGFERIDEKLVQNGIFGRKEFQSGGKVTEIYAKFAPKRMVAIQTSGAGIFSGPGLEVYASGDYERLEKGLLVFPKRRVRLELLARLNGSFQGWKDAKKMGGRLEDIKRALKERENRTPVNSFLFDLHAHCGYGEWIRNAGYVSPEELVRHAWFRTGLDGIVLAPHHKFEGDKSWLGLVKAGREIGRLAAKMGLDGKFLLLKGLEYFAEGNKQSHVLAIYPEDVDLKEVTGKYRVGWDVPTALDFIHSHGGVAIAVHPFLPVSGLGESAVRGNPFDGIEVRNGYLAELCPAELKRLIPGGLIPRQAMARMESLNGKAEKLGTGLKKSNPSLALTAGSDCHIASHVGICATRIEAERFDCESMLRAIKQGRTQPYGNCTNCLTLPKRMISGGIAGGAAKIFGTS